MKKTKIDVIRAWKDPKYRASLSSEELKSIEANPVGEALENLEDFRGGQVIRSSAGDNFQGCGWVGSISGECNGGSCCNPFYSWFSKVGNPGLENNPGILTNPNLPDTKVALGDSVSV